MHINRKSNKIGKKKLFISYLKKKNLILKINKKQHKFSVVVVVVRAIFIYVYVFWRCLLFLKIKLERKYLIF